MSEWTFCSSATAAPPDFSPEKRSLRIHGRSTTVRLERMFWCMLEEMARSHGLPLPRLIEILYDRVPLYGARNLASCCRVICLTLCQGKIRADAAAVIPPVGQ